MVYGNYGSDDTFTQKEPNGGIFILDFYILVPGYQNTHSATRGHPWGLILNFSKFIFFAIQIFVPTRMPLSGQTGRPH